jgi:PEP-CTERM motif
MKLSTISVKQLSTTIALTILAATTLGQVKPAAAENLIKNGNFEAPVDLQFTYGDAGGWGTYEQIQGWKATNGGKIEIQTNGIAGSPYEGKHLVELDSHFYDKDAPDLGLFQDVATKVGQKYELSFAYSARPYVTGAGQNSFNLLFGDQFKQVLDAGDGGTQTDWRIFKQTVTATSNLTRLQFNYMGSRDYLGAYIDDVKLSKATPEPAAMLGLGLAGMGMLARKRQRANG